MVQEISTERTSTDPGGDEYLISSPPQGVSSPDGADSVAEEQGDQQIPEDESELDHWSGQRFDVTTR